VSLDRLLERAAASPARLLLAGGDNAQLRQVTSRLAAGGIRSAQLVGDGGLNPESHPRHESVASLLRSRAPERVRDAIHALDLAADPLRFALGLAALGEAEAVVAGTGTPTTELIDAARWTLGGPDGDGGLCFAGWLQLGDGRLIAFADCGAGTRLDAAGQRRLGESVAGLHARVAGEAPKVALLPGFRGEENVLIFPDGAAGSLALRIAKQLAGARFLGPLLLGVGGVVGGVAADADEDELVGTAAATVLAAGRAGT